jgi:hypothetical protein
LLFTEAKGFAGCASRDEGVESGWPSLLVAGCGDDDMAERKEEDQFV